MTLVVQPSLFGSSGELGVAELGVAVERRPLSDGAWVCLYRDGSDSVAWHGDRIARESARDTMVAIVSLGATRPFGLRPKSGGRGLRLQVGHGDLLVMGGSCQRTWLHSIPKVATCLGSRISIQFRPQWGENLGKPAE